MQQAGVVRPTEELPRDHYTYYPGTAAVPESVAVNIRGCSYMIEAEVEVLDDKCSGVIFAHGSRFGGHSLFIRDDDDVVAEPTNVVEDAKKRKPTRKTLYYVYNFLGILPEQTFCTTDALKPGKYTFLVTFNKWEKPGEYGKSEGTLTLSVRDDNDTSGSMKEVASGPMSAQVGKFTLCGDGLCVGYDSADAVSKLYSGTNPFKGGTIKKVVITPGTKTRAAKEAWFAAAFAVD